MRLSAEGLELVKRWEGYRQRTYLDIAGFPTIGYGHRLLASESFSNGIEEAQANEILACDVRGAEQAVTRLVKVALTQNQFDALVDFVFNLGQGKFATSTLLKELNSGHYDTAREQLLRWDRAGAQENANLKARRKSEFDLWSSAASQHETAA
jgi:lysozyme